MTKPDVRSAKIIEVIKVEHCEGLGISQDPCRIVVYWYEKNGDFIAKRDHWLESKSPNTEVME